jgi:LysM repeat protein
MASTKHSFSVCSLALLVAGCSANARFDMSEYQDPSAARPVNGTSTASLPNHQNYGYNPSYPPAAYPPHSSHPGSTASVPAHQPYGYSPSYPTAAYQQSPATPPWSNPTNTASIPSQRSYGYTPSYPPAATRTAPTTASLGWSADRPEVGSTNNVHVVREGDTLWGIAKRYNVPVAQIYSANGLLNDKLTPGQHLAIPAKTPAKPRLASN